MRSKISNVTFKIHWICGWLIYHGIRWITDLFHYHQAFPGSFIDTALDILSFGQMLTDSIVSDLHIVVIFYACKIPSNLEIYFKLFKGFTAETEMLELHMKTISCQYCHEFKYSTVLSF